jgi:putative Holliday junction resolvase
MSRIIAIDYGTKRVGLAVTDPLKIIATALDTIHAKDVIQFLKNYHQTEVIETFVVGMPKNLDGTATDATRHVEIFIKQLGKHFPDISVHTIDERYTSKIAVQAMITGGMKKKDRQNKGNVDKISAVILLQDFMKSL